MIYVDMERLGPVLTDAVLPIPPASLFDGNETLGPVLMDAVLPIPPVRFDVLSERYWGRY